MVPGTCELNNQKISKSAGKLCSWNQSSYLLMSRNTTNICVFENEIIVHTLYSQFTSLEAKK